MNIVELMDYTRRIVSDKAMSLWHTDRELLDHISAAYEMVNNKFVNFDNGWAEVSIDFTYVAPTSPSTEVNFNLPFWFKQIKLVEFIDGNGRITENTAWPADQIRMRHPGYEGWWGFLYWIRRNRFTLELRKSGGFQAPTKVRVWFYRTPPGLCAFQPDAATDTTVDLPTVTWENLGKVIAADSYYDGAMWEIVSGPGQGQVFEFESFTALNRRGTLLSGTTLSPVPTVDSVIAAVPFVPPDAHPLIAYMAARDGTRIEENAAGHALFSGEIGERWLDIERNQSLRQVQLSRQIVQTEG